MIKPAVTVQGGLKGPGEEIWASRRSALNYLNDNTFIVRAGSLLLDSSP